MKEQICQKGELYNKVKAFKVRRTDFLASIVLVKQ